MINLEKERAAVITSSTAMRISNLPVNSGTPSIAFFILNGNGYVPFGIVPGVTNGLTDALLLESSSEALILRNLFAHLETELGSGLKFSAEMSGPRTVNNKAEGMANERISELGDYLRRNKSEKTAQGYSYDVRNVFAVISMEFFNDVALDKLNLSEITAEQVQRAEQKLFKNGDLKPSTLSRLKQGWNCFCTFIGMNTWKFIETVNATPEYKDDVISNEDILKMLDYCQEQRQAADTDFERIRWFRKEISIRLGYEMGFRSCEYGNATFDEVEKDKRITIKHSKHNGTRTVAVTNDTKAVILEFKVFLQNNNLYPSGGGIFEKVDGKNYSTSTFRRWLKATALACKVNSSFAKTHGLRHRFAKNFYSYTHDEIMLANIMGHKSTKTTRQYAAPTFENLQSAMQAASDNARVNCKSKVA